ncbi:non-specific serine/threonine protein kinase [Ranunculus cassubicifolius]
MEMPGRRSNYSLLSQFPEEQSSNSSSGVVGAAQFYETLSAESNSNRFQQRIPNLIPSIGGVGLQRQSSGSSFGESSLSGEYYVPTLGTSDQDTFDLIKSGGGEVLSKGREPPGSSKSWAQQTEESYQLQLALALRLSNDATCADDPHFLDPVPDESARRSSTTSPEILSHRFWVNGCLSYFDRIPDGFYLISGMDPYIWTMCTDPQENGRVPSIDSLKAMYVAENSSVEVVLIDKHSDLILKELQNRAISLSQSCISVNEVVDHLAKLICNHMGGTTSNGEYGLVPRWKDCSEDLKDCLETVVFPIGSLSVGLCRHRALLFKVLADIVDLPCRVAKGCKYCRTDDASSCLVRFGLDREYLVDLMEKPGCLYEPDSILNGPSSISISSPLRLPKLKPFETTENTRSLAKQYFMDCQSLNIIFGDAPAGMTDDKEHRTDPLLEDLERSHSENLIPVPGSADSYVILPQRAQSEDHGVAHHPINSRTPQNLLNPIHLVTEPIPMMHVLPDEKRLLPSVGMTNPRLDPRFIGGSRVASSKSDTELSLDVEDLDIPWDDLILKEKIGAGSFGTVHRADWNGSEVAVKILMEQDFHAVRFKEFLREVALMKRLRHPNIVLFMGAVTQPPNLSIVTEYLSRGSLYRLLHKSGAREMLDERRRISMAFDVAKGMNYLHRRNPPIVHRDLKSPNLLVDKKYTVKVCDFGLSRLKANTFLSAKSAAGTPEWMAPEVLRDEPSNEKCDVYSFGVILWELMTLQLPWSNLNQAQVVFAVGFKNKRLEIPPNVNPQVGILIEACWSNEPWKRPSFSSIMEALRPLIKPPTPQPVHAALPRLT